MRKTTYDDTCTHTIAKAQWTSNVRDQIHIHQMLRCPRGASLIYNVLVLQDNKVALVFDTQTKVLGLIPIVHNLPFRHL